MAARFRFTPRVFPLEGDVDGVRLTRALGDLRGPVLLDSAAGQPRRWSLMGFEPLQGVTLPAHPEELASLLQELEPVGGDPVPGPFAGGFLGAIAYECGPLGEALSLPPDPQGLPRLMGGLYVDFVVVDHEAAQAWLVLGEEPGDGRPSVDVRREAVLSRWAAPSVVPEPRALGPLVRHVEPALHRARVEAVQAAIRAGELYQANLAQRWSLPMEATAAGLFLALRAHNPAPYMGWLATPRGALVSSSPELLLESDGRFLRSRPIKGTRPRSADPSQDAALAKELLASAKDRAELAMIVDLVRNDLSRVAARASVRVGDLPELESHASVHHLAADVCAELASGRTALDALLSLFPGGSITGAPKARSMEVLAELEGTGRGFFTGTLGALDLAGRAQFNILIRTLTVRWDAPGASSGEVAFQAGGGITASSDPVLEEEETRVKALRMAQALGVDLESAQAGDWHSTCTS